jgi:hypothetical protein
MQIETFERTLDEETAVERTRNLSLTRYLRSRLSALRGRPRSTEEHTVHLIYYPDYIAYTSATIQQSFGRTRSLRFLAGIDAITGAAGEIDVELPSYGTEDVDSSRVIVPEVEEGRARETWREWLFEYVGRYHRASGMPQYSLDRMELVYTPYWIIDNGTLDRSLVVSDLTRRTAKVEEIDVVERFYRNHVDEEGRS